MINIEDLIPLLRKGWVAMDEDGEWHWFSEEPESCVSGYIFSPFTFSYSVCLSDAFDIAPANDWKKSLRKVG